MQPQDAYGLEKLASEQLVMHYNKDFGMECRIARFHNIYGPQGTWKGGREKAPAAFCRKVTASLKKYSLAAVLTNAAPCCGLEVAVIYASVAKGMALLHANCRDNRVALQVPAVDNASKGLPYSIGSPTFEQVLTSVHDVEMWGDGLQTRSFTYIDDCVEGILRITKSEYREPLNLGSSEMVGARLVMHIWMPVSVAQMHHYV